VLLLSTAYFAPVQYYSKLVRDEQVIIERYEHYTKQSWRNRCTIFSANGLIDLVVPVAKINKPKISITEAEISYDTLWQKLHFKAIESAYRRSPYYEYYIDDLMVFFNCRHRYLYEFNMLIMSAICSLLKIPFCVQETDQYIHSGQGITDLRNNVHPKIDWQHTDPHFVPPYYRQVFADRWGFKANLSILDLLFNTGPEAKNLLLRSVI